MQMEVFNFTFVSSESKAVLFTCNSAVSMLNTIRPTFVDY